MPKNKSLEKEILSNQERINLKKYTETHSQALREDTAPDLSNKRKVRGGRRKFLKVIGLGVGIYAADKILNIEDNVKKFLNDENLIHVGGKDFEAGISSLDSMEIGIKTEIKKNGDIFYKLAGVSPEQKTSKYINILKSQKLDLDFFEAFAGLDNIIINSAETKEQVEVESKTQKVQEDFYPELPEGYKLLPRKVNGKMVLGKFQKVKNMLNEKGEKVTLAVYAIQKPDGSVYYLKATNFFKDGETNNVTKEVENEYLITFYSIKKAFQALNLPITDEQIDRDLIRLKRYKSQKGEDMYGVESVNLGRTLQYYASKDESIENKLTLNSDEIGEVLVQYIIHANEVTKETGYTKTDWNSNNIIVVVVRDYNTGTELLFDENGNLTNDINKGKPKLTGSVIGIDHTGSVPVSKVNGIYRIHEYQAKRQFETLFALLLLDKTIRDQIPQIIAYLKSNFSKEKLNGIIGNSKEHTFSPEVFSIYRKLIEELDKTYNKK